MKHTTLIAGALLALAAPAAAQVWAGDNFDSYADGTVLQNVGGWRGWDGVAGAAGTVTSVRRQSLPHSMRCNGTTDAVHPNIGATCGKWTFTAWQRITLGDLAAGPVFLILMNDYSDGGPYGFTVEVRATNSTGMIEDDFIDGVMRTGAPLPIIYDRWVQYRCEIDLDADTITTFYDGVQLSTGKYTILGGPAEIENIDLFSAGGTCFWDDISLKVVAPLNEFDVFPGPGQTGVTSISRGNFGTGEGSAWQGYPPSHFRGIGDDGTSCTLGQFNYIIQDQNTVTADAYTFAVRSGTVAGPTPGAPGLLYSFPTATPVGTGGVGAWSITLTPASPVTIPCADHFFVGWQFPPAPLWSATDGPSTQLRIQTADAQLAGQPHHSWQFIGNPNTPGTISQTSGRVWLIKLRTPCPALNVGSTGALITPDFGATGMYTKVAPAGSGLGITFRVRDASNPMGTAIILFGTAYDPSFGLGSFGIKGNLWLTTGLVGQLHTMPLDAAGLAIGGPAWMGTNMLHRLGGGTPAFVLFQAITYHGALCNVRASNGAGTRIF